MEHDSKLAFLQNMTHLALNHAARVPNAVLPTGGMSHDKMLEFVNKGMKLGIQHMSLGGALSGAIGSNVDYQAGAAPILNGTNKQDLENAGTNANTALQQQSNIAAPLQSGLTQGANAQTNLGQQLFAETQGGGPNPAQAQLNQATGQNIAQQAALAAGQRGAGANAGLIAAQNAQQGAATQQQSAGQAATLGAQQQIAAQNNLQNLSASQVAQGQGAVQGLNNAAQNEQNILQGANTAFNNAQVGMQSNINNVNAGIAQGNAGTNANIVGGIASGLSSIAGSLFADGGMVKMDKGGNVLDANARAHIAPDNFALPGNRYPIHDINHARNALARVSQYGTPAEKAKVKAAVHKKYPEMGKKMASGGAVVEDKRPNKKAMVVKPPKMMAEGGVLGAQVNGPQSFVGNWLNSAPASSGGPLSVPQVSLNTQGVSPFANIKAPSFQGKSQLSDQDVNDITDSAPKLSTGASDLPGAIDPGTMLAASGGLMKKGGKVNASAGQKAVKKDDSLENDKVPTMLSEGEIVLPRHITMHPNAPAMAAQFVAQTLAKRGQK